MRSLNIVVKIANEEVLMKTIGIKVRPETYLNERVHRLNFLYFLGILSCLSSEKKPSNVYAHQKLNKIDVIMSK